MGNFSTEAGIECLDGGGGGIGGRKIDKDTIGRKITLFSPQNSLCKNVGERQRERERERETCRGAPGKFKNRLREGIISRPKPKTMSARKNVRGLVPLKERGQVKGPLNVQ